jgi:hypothetical protein
LAEARDNRDAARRLLAKGIDPSEQRKSDKRDMELRDANSFAAVALEWHGKRVGTWTARHADDVLRRIEMNLIPTWARAPSRKSKRRNCLPLLAESKAGERTTWRIA